MDDLRAVTAKLIAAVVAKEGIYASNLNDAVAKAVNLAKEVLKQTEAEPKLNLDGLKTLNATVADLTDQVVALKAELAACQQDKAQTVTALLTADRQIRLLKADNEQRAIGRRTFDDATCGAGGRRTVDDRGVQVKPNTCVHGVLLGTGCPACGAGGRRVVEGGLELIGPGACVEAPPQPEPPPPAFTAEQIEKARAHLAAKGKHCVHERPLGEPCGACGRGPVTAGYFDGPQRPAPSEFPAPGGGGVLTSSDGALRGGS